MVINTQKTLKEIIDSSSVETPSISQEITGFVSAQENTEVFAQTGFSDGGVIGRALKKTMNKFRFEGVKNAWKTAGLIGAMMTGLYGCSDKGTGPGVGDDVEISWSPLEAQNKTIYSPTITLSGGEGFRELNIQRAGWDTTMSISGTRTSQTIEDFLDFSRNDLPTDVNYTVTATQTSGDKTTRNFDVFVDYINQAPQAEITTKSRVFGGQVPIEISFSDDYGLESAFLEIDGVRYDFNVQGKTTKQMTINHSLSSTGTVEWFGEVVDDEGQVTSFSGDLYNVPKFNFEIGARGFYDKGIDRDLSLTIRNLELGEEYKLSANNNGVISAELFEGPHIISDVEGKYYPIGRMRVSRDIYGDDRQFNPGEEFTYIVTGIERTPWLINLTKDLNPNDFYIETIDRNTNPYTRGDLVENLSRLLRYDYIAVPRRSQPQTIVFNYGNPDWPEGFDIWDDFILNDDIPNEAQYLPGEGRYPPGHPFTQEGINNFNGFINDLMTRVYESDIGGINPYEISVVKDTAENLKDYFARGPPYVFGLKDNVHYIGGNGKNKGLEGRTFTKSSSGAEFIAFTRMLVPGTSMGTNNSNTWFSNERNLTGTTREAQPKICSVKDGIGDFEVDHGTLPMYCLALFNTPDRSSFKPIDILADNLFVHVGAWSEFQPNKRHFSRGDDYLMQNMWNTSASDEGFNVYLVNYLD